MPIDFKPSKQHYRRRHRWITPLLLFICLAVAGTLIVALNKPQPADTAKDSTDAKDHNKIIKGVIQPGDTVSSLLGGHLSPKQLHELTLKCQEVYQLSRISAGQSFKLSLEEGNFKRFSYDIDDNDKLVINLDDQDFSVSRKPIQYLVEKAVVHGTITSSLFQSVIDIGESEGLAIQLADIFAWDINFFHDIRKGDSFTAVVEKRFRNGQPASNGRLLAASFTVQGKTHQAFHFQDGKQLPDYYDPDGRSLRKAFLKAPLSFSRISSGFNMRRRHPITKRIKEHPAIDYAAPTGTPVKTVGNGIVTYAGFGKHNGNYVKIKHPGGWMTMYNHLSRFGKKIRPGTQVAQGQVIGYVGSTGLSTGPHLDFRMYKNGKPVNPLKIKSPPARPISTANIAEFRVITAELVALMENTQLQQTTRTPHSIEPKTPRPSAC